MAYRLIILEEADQEYQEAAKWYEEKGKGLGHRFIDVIENKLKVIQKFPERYPKRKADFREAPVKTFPFIIVFTFYKSKGIITINSIFHTSRNPRRKYPKNKA